MPVGGLDALKSLLQQRKAEKQELVGDKKYVRKSELEEAKLKRLRQEEEAERRAKVIMEEPGAVAVL
jgi:pre-mRNA-splicing factor 18